MNLQPAPLYLSTLPSKARFRRQHFTSAHWLWPDWWHNNLCICGEHGAGKTPNSPPPLLLQSQISFQEKPNPPSHSWLLEMSLSASTGHNTAALQQGTAKTQHPLPAAALQLLCAPLGQTAASEPLPITVIASWFCFCEPPSPYQLLRKPLAIYCQASFEIGFFNQEVNILYYCGFRLIIILF